MTSTSVQDEVCEFVRELIAARAGEQLSIASRPELDHRNDKAVEELWDAPSRGYAVEHTRVESFERQLANIARIKRLLTPLTRVIALGLRRLFVDFYGPASSSDVHHHVVYRQGDDPKDHRAWTAAKPDKWITVHGLNFVPDVLIRRTLNPVTDVLPIEIKLVTTLACSQDVATAVGQALAYSVKHPQSIAFVGVRRGLTDGTHALTNPAEQSRNEATLHRRLKGLGVSLLFREVDVVARGS